MKPPDSTLTSEVKQPERKRKKLISVPGVVYVLIFHCYGGAEDLFPQLMKAQSEMLPLRFSWQVQISLIDIKAVMITLPRTHRRTTPGCHVPAVIAWQGPWIYGEQARLCPNLCKAIFFLCPLEHIGIRMDHALEGDLIFMNSSC